MEKSGTPMTSAAMPDLNAMPSADLQALIR